VQVELGPVRLHQQFAGAVVEEERDVQSFLGNLHPIVVLSRLTLLPCGGPIEVAGFAGNGSGQRVGPGGEAADLDQPHGGAANFRSGRVEQQTLAGEQAESAEEQIQAAGDADQGDDGQFADREKDGKGDDHSSS